MRSSTTRFVPRYVLVVPFLVLIGLTGCEVIEDIIRSISDGAACTQDGQCLGGKCLLDNEGFPGGYCTTLECDTQGCTNIFGADCLSVNQTQSAGPICYSSCDLDEDCREGYRCADVDGTRICLPTALSGGLPAAGETGTSCNRDSDCLGGTCLLNYTRGYCTTMNCESDADCTPYGDGRCLEMGEESGYKACFDGCSEDDECRFGYGCTDPDQEGGVCDVLDEANPVRNPGGADDGQPCLVDINCKGGTCMRSEEGYPEGHCTTLNCTRVGCNGTGTVCINLENDTACFIECSSQDQCREGYECSSSGYCSPPLNVTQPTDPTGTLEIVCESESISGGRRFTFPIQSGTVSFAVVSIADGVQIRPVRLRLPNGSVGANFDTDHAFLDITWQYLVNLAPVFFPAAPQFRSLTQQGGGQYSLDVQTTDPACCYYLLEKSQEGSQLAINLYFVGVPGIQASTASTNTNLQEMIDAMRTIYGRAGITISTVRYFDITGDNQTRYQIIRNINAIFELLALSSSPGDTLADNLSVNIFLIQDFAIPEAPGLLGLSAGIPGIPGLHGTHGSGLVFTSVNLGYDNGNLGQTMAHEVGHYCGLRHTTEHDRSTDPISDTPSCIDPNLGAICSDSTNLMFPFSISGVDQTTITSGQAQVLRWCPLVR
ncbi:MAG: hypothetical protein JW797_02870 [Bradymonadales bacterium]|nr:hypothetical protein [Bradymonadales bacterium]